LESLGEDSSEKIGIEFFSLDKPRLGGTVINVGFFRFWFLRQFPTMLELRADSYKLLLKIAITTGVEHSCLTGAYCRPSMNFTSFFDRNMILSEKFRWKNSMNASGLYGESSHYFPSLECQSWFHSQHKLL